MPTPPRRPPVLAALVVVALTLTLAACGGSGAKTLGSSGTTAPRPTAKPGGVTTTTAASSGKRLEVTTPSWQLAAAVSREAIATDGTSIFLGGGLNSANVSTDAVVKIDPATGAQSRLATLSPAVHDTAGAWFANSFLVIAGGSPPARSTVQAIAGSGAIRTLGQIPQVRADHVVAVAGSTLYVLGGGDEASALLNSIVSSPDGVTWKSAGTLSEAVRYPAVAASGGAVFLFGGVASSAGTDTKSVQKYDPASGTTSVVAQLPAALSHASAVVLGGSIYVIGGFVDNKLSTQILRFDPATNQVTAVGNLPAVVSDAGAVVVGTTAYVIGGEGTERRALPTVYALRLA